MGNSSKHRAVGLMASSTRRQAIQNILPDYDFYWDVELKGAIQTVADLRPSFLVVDIDDMSLEWQPIIIALQTSPATRRIPMLAVAAATTADSMKRAESLAGPLAYANLAEQLPDWVKRHARLWDADYYATLGTACQQPLSDLAREGLALFNAREFWEAHEVLEQAWMAVRPHPIGELYRSILQVGVAYYQIQRGNYQGAIKMFLRAVQWLDPLPDHCQGVDVAQFKRDAAAARAELERLGSEGIQAFDQNLFKVVPFLQDVKQ